MKRRSVLAMSVALLAIWARADYDIVIYGGTSAGIAAAVQAKRAGKSVVVVEPGHRIGGLTTGGLGQTDIGNKSAIHGIAREFYEAVKTYYDDPKAWKWQRREEYTAEGKCRRDPGEERTMWTFEPSAALKILEGWEKRDGIEIHRGERLVRGGKKVKIEGEVEGEGEGEGEGRGGGRGRRIVSFETESGREYRARMFIDATYEGDLMAEAGVSYTVGREGNEVYGETVNGCQYGEKVAGAGNHQPKPGISAYVVPGDRSSGLLPGIEPWPIEKPGTGDRRVQAYCFRSCLTDCPENRIPFRKPEEYDEKDYELLFRNLEAGENWFVLGSCRQPNRKTDTNNNRGTSLDLIGGNWNYPEASYAERERIVAAHLKYQQGLFWTLAYHPRTPRAVREFCSKFGTCRDEFEDGFGDGWQRQLYIREARRMVGDYVMTEANCRGSRVAERPVAFGAYTMDSHHVRRYETPEGFVRNEGNVEDPFAADGKTRMKPYPIDYGALVPKRGECANLLVPVCLSASHIAYGSIRMEPVFFELGQAAAAAAAVAIEKKAAVQDVPYGALKGMLPIL